MFAKKDIKSILGSGSILFVATLLVNVVNYGLNLFLSRWLGPELYAEANIIATLVMALSFMAMGFQLSVAKIVAEGKQKFLAQFAKKVRTTSLFVLVISCLLIPLLSSFLQFERWYPLLILAVGIPSYLLMSLYRGSYQGAENFRKLSMTYIVEVFVRLVVTLGLLFLLKDIPYKTEVVSLGFLASFLVTHLYSLRPLKAEGTKSDSDSEQLQSVFYFLVAISFYELSQILINNSDVILVKHYFVAHEAGLYSALALLGRGVFFATWSIVMVLFPKVISKEKRGEPHIKLFWTALTIVGIIGLLFVLATKFFGEEIILLAFGSQYVEVSEYLWIYCSLTTLFACANVFVYYNLSLKRYIPVLISILFGVLQIFIICFYHESLMQVLLVQLGLMLCLFVSMIGYQLSTGVSQLKMTHSQNLS